MSASLLATAAPGDGSSEAPWLQRDNPGAEDSLQSSTEAGLKAAPESFEVLWRAARVKQWLADGEKDKARKMQLGKDAWALGEKAIKANPNAVEGYYFAALGIGAYSQGAGILRALGEGLESKFNDRLDRAIKLDPAYRAAGALVAKGRYWFELPWPKRSIGRSIETLERAIAAHPENLRAYVYLAESQLKDGKAKLAEATLQKAVRGDVSYDPPEGRRAKLMAATVEPQIQKELK